MLPLIGLAASLIPEIIRLIAGDKDAQLASKISGVVSDLVGTTDPVAAQQKIDADPAVKANLQAKLAEIAVTAQQQQDATDIERRKLDLESFRESLADTDSARSKLLALAQTNSPIAWGAPVVSLIVATGFFTILWALASGKIDTVNTNHDIVLTLVGTMATSFATTVAFWLGSSKGSRDKDETVKQLGLSQARQANNIIDRSSALLVNNSNNSKGLEVNQKDSDDVRSLTPKDSFPKKPNFDRSLQEILVLEGGFTNDPNDAGGMTTWGITRDELAQYRKVAPDSLDEADMQALSKEEAGIIYRTRYWNVLRCDDLPSGVDFMSFQFGVLAGTGTSAQLLQGLVNTRVDGAVGPLTISAVAAANKKDLISQLQRKQLDYLATLPKWQVYSKGWTSRVMSATSVADSMA